MNYLMNLIAEYGLIAMFIIILLEYACFPVSSEIVLPFSGAVASLNQTPFLVILPLSILAGLIGTGICFTIGWFGGGAIINGIKTKFPKSANGIDSSYEKFQKNGAAAVCIGRVIPLIRTYIALVAGAAKLNPVTYFFASMLGITAWNTLLIGLGYSLRENYKLVAEYYERYKSNLIPVFLIAFLFFIGNRIYKKRKEKVSV
ncbi:MAG TPA: DedA family protein [Clostridiales bacterium]|jgi:membrane protein DedA with SNARE-associated domain|nr:DedA family protein [Clostridiales bacterium]